jgi:hypothetical protein
MDTGERRAGRVVITAAHCLPHISTEFPLEELTYINLLGSLGDDPSISAECLFVDPVADLAVLGCPDTQRFYRESDLFESWIADLVAFRLGATRDGSEKPCWLLSLTGQWRQGKAGALHDGHGPLWVSGVEAGIIGGMSGGPIVTTDGAAISLVSHAFGSIDLMVEGQCPRLTHHLPAWLVRALTAARREESRM